jgi:hypothetical protein
MGAIIIQLVLTILASACVGLLVSQHHHGMAAGFFMGWVLLGLMRIEHKP